MLPKGQHTVSFVLAFANSSKKMKLFSPLAFSTNNIHKVNSLCWSTKKIFSPYQSDCQKIRQEYIYMILILIILLTLIFSWSKKIYGRLLPLLHTVLYMLHRPVSKVAHCSFVMEGFSFFHTSLLIVITCYN